jgi:phage major head subunit gpT-like protein
MPSSLSIQSALEASNTTFDSAYEDVFAGKTLPGAHSYYTDEEPATSLTKRFDWLANIPMMERWIGARRVKFLRAYSQLIRLEPWVATEEFRRIDLQYGDQLGLIGRHISQWLSKQANVYDKDAFEQFYLNAGVGPVGYDGVPLFSTTHPHGPTGPQSNLSAALNFGPASLETVLTAMSGLKLENGEPAGVDGDTIIVGPALKYKALALVGASSDVRPVPLDNTGKEAAVGVVTAASASNVYQGTLKVVVDTRIAATGPGAFFWTVVDSRFPKPLVRHVGRAPEPHHQDQMDSPVRFEKDRFRYGLEGDWTTDAGLWLAAHRATGTAAA